jgi:hypothetical protein
MLILEIGLLFILFGCASKSDKAAEKPGAVCLQMQLNTLPCKSAATHAQFRASGMAVDICPSFRSCDA